MKKVLLASVIAGLSAGLTAPVMAADNKYEQYQAAIAERGDSGVSGNAVFIPENGGMTVELSVENADGLSAGIHAGVCRYAEDSAGAPETLAFKRKPLAELDAIDGTESSSTTDLTISALMESPHSVAIHDGDTVVACGNIQ